MGTVDVRTRTRLSSLWFLLFFVCLVSRADFETALATYHRGDYPAAIELFTTLGHDGHGDAQHNLGQMYRLGQGVTPDDRVAASWYHRAAEQGVVPSQFNLGVMYELGRGVEQSLEERNLWFRHAARAGHMEARYALGLAYTDGEGTPPSESDALYWFHRATQSGHDKAPARVDQLYRHRHKLPLSDLIGDETARQKIVIHPVDASDNHLAFTLDKPAATTSYHYIAATNIWKAHWGIYLSPDYDAGFRYIESQRGFHFPIRIEGNLHTLGKLWPLL